MTTKRKASPQKTTLLKPKEVERQWYIFDAKGKTLGRFASEIAKVLRGKHKTTYTPSTDGGDGVIVLNAGQIRVTGNKEAQKVYRYYTGGIGGLREVPYRDMMQRKPDYAIRHAVEGMIPNNVLGREQCTRLRIFAGEEHDLEAQKPIKVNC